MDTCQFLKEFEDVPRVQLYTHKDLEQELNQINNVLLDTNKDWVSGLSAEWNVFVISTTKSLM